MIKIIVVENQEELAMAGSLRWLVYVIQRGEFKNKNFPENKMLDKHDFSGHSTVFLALYQEFGGREIPVATIRLTRDSKKYGLPLVDNYNIEELRRKRQFKEPIFSVGMLAVHKDFRSLALVMNLIRFLTAHAIEMGAKDVVATINYELERMMNAIGLMKFNSAFWSKEVGNLVIPIYGTVDILQDKLCRRILPNEPIPYIANYGDINEMRIYSKGEILCREGEAGNAAFIIIQGSAIVMILRHRGKEYQIALIGPGSIIGEMALLEENGSRSATVRANADLTVLVLKREKLLAALEEPAKDLTMLNVLTERICQLNSCVNGAFIYNREESIIPLPKNLLVFIKTLERKEYAEGETICEEGKIGNEAYLIERGKVAVFLGNVRVAILPQGSLFGETALIRENQARTATVIATDLTVLTIIKKPDLLGNAEFLRYLCILQSLRIRKMNELVTSCDTRGRICDNLINALQTLHL
ncbi:MAG: cyclic nucleotide-binding domain-containing protein, partial [bacterium]|nr:cyclic nucleotide-binding domain-containing protein [bacterium]